MAFSEFTGHQYLAIDIANNFGLDKADWNDRLSWFNENEHKLGELVEQAETPALFYAGMQAWDKCQNGEASGYPISLDATASGLQLYAVLTGDRKAAELCNVVDTGKREDAYTGVYEAMAAMIGEAAKIQRADTKQAIMCSFYGSEAEPKKVFGEGTLLNVFIETMQRMAPAAWELRQAFLDLWDGTKDKNSWVMPDNFHVHVKVMDRVTEVVHFMNEPFETYRQVNQPKEKGRSLGANCTHSTDGLVVREMTRRCDYDPVKVREVKRVLFTEFDMPEQIEDTPDARLVEILWSHFEASGYLSARILDHITTDNVHLIPDRGPILELIESLPEKPFKVLSVHDCFRCLPNYGNDLRRQYNLQLYLIARSRLLSYLLTQITGQDMPITKYDETLADDVLKANYALS